MIFNKDFRRIRLNKIILGNLTLPATGKVIDISCGEGRLLQSIADLYPTLELYGSDINLDYSITQDNTKVHFLEAPANHLPFPDQYFDTVICSMSFHHFDKPLDVIKEIDRILKPDGTAYVTDIFPKNKWSQYVYNIVKCHEPYHFEKFYTDTELSNLFKKFDLTITKSLPVTRISRIHTLQIVK